MARSNGQYNGKLQQILPPALSSISRDQRKGCCMKGSLHQYEDINDDEDDDESSNTHGTAEKRQRLTVEQVNFLERSFNMDLKLEPERKAEIAKQLGIRPRKVAIWFQNRRARWKNKQLEQDYEILKADYEALIKDKENIRIKNEAIVEENNKLQAEVSRLKGLLERRCSTSSLTAECMISTLKEELLSSKSELTSPTKLSVGDRSDVQDSGQSCCPTTSHEETELGPCIQEISELNVVKVEGEDPAPVFPVDEAFPLFFYQPIATICTEFGGHLLFNSYEDHFGGFT